jgi:SAM-dependent methyltransferase
LRIQVGVVCTPEEQELHERLRYLLQCVEAHHFDPGKFPDGREHDEYDEDATAILARTPRREAAGTVRVAYNLQRPLPLQRIFDIPIVDGPVAEIGRLNVHPDFRSSESMVLLAMCRILWDIVQEKQLVAVYAMLEKRLLLKLQRLGFPFEPVAEAKHELGGDLIPCVCMIDQVMPGLRARDERTGQEVSRFFEHPFSGEIYLPNRKVLMLDSLRQHARSLAAVAVLLALAIGWLGHDWVLEHWYGSVAVAGFVVLYVVTWGPAWKLLGYLVAASATRQRLASRTFWARFVLYRTVIAAPYLWLLALGVGGMTLRSVIVGFLALGLVLGLLRMLGGRRTIAVLWWAYGCVYDGLENFWPYKNLVSLVAFRVNAKPAMRVLELGCGTGNVIKEIRRLYPDTYVDGVDVSTTMLKRARQKLEADIEGGAVTLHECELLSYLGAAADNFYDRITMVNVLYAVPDRDEVWRQCQRVLKPGGKIVATTSDRGGAGPIIREHLEHDSWKSLLSLKLVGVVIIDFFISSLASAGAFEYVEEGKLMDEVINAGGQPGRVQRVYGGAENGVNLLFDVDPAEELRAADAA